MVENEKQITFELIDGKLIEDVNNSIRFKLVDDMCRDSPVPWDWDGTSGLLFDSVRDKIEGINRAREIIAGLHGKEYKPLDPHGYFNKYIELCKTGRNKVIEECNLHPDTHGFFSYRESDQRRDKMRCVAIDVAEGLETHFE